MAVNTSRTTYLKKSMAPAAGGKERNSSDFPGVEYEDFSTFFSVDPRD